jgi:chromosome segregation ATPase
VSALSKTFIVLVTLFAVALVTLMVPNIVNQQNYEKKLKQYERNWKSAEVTAALRQTDIAYLSNNDSARLENANAQIESLQKDRAAQVQRAQNAEADSRKNQTAATEANDRANTLADASKQLSTVLDATKTELISRNDDLLKLNKQNIELSTQLEIEQSKVDQYAYQLKLLQEEIVALTERNGELVAFIKAKGLKESEVGKVGLPPVPVQGQITKVEQLPSGKLLAQVNVGLNSKVSKNMKFLVHRGDLFLGHLKITFVDDTSAAGILTPRSRQTQVVPGDLVRTALN